jgi:hypothetical protein
MPTPSAEAIGRSVARSLTSIPLLMSPLFGEKRSEWSPGSKNGVAKPGPRGDAPTDHRTLARKRGSPFTAAPGRPCPRHPWVRARRVAPPTALWATRNQRWPGGCFRANLGLRAVATHPVAARGPRLPFSTPQSPRRSGPLEFPPTWSALREKPRRATRDLRCRTRIECSMSLIRDIVLQGPIFDQFEPGAKFANRHLQSEK